MTQRRIVLFGTQLAGKRSIVKHIEYVRNGKSSVITLPEDGRSECHDRALLTSFDVDRRHFEVSTIPGCVWDMTSWSRLLDAATDIVLVIDPQRTQIESNYRMLAYLMGTGRAIFLRAVQVTKGDLIQADFPCIDLKPIKEIFNLFELPFFVSRIDVQRSLLQAVNHVLESP